MSRRRRSLPFWFLAPAGLAVTLFYLIPVVLTFVFSFTTMSSHTGILGDRYVLGEAALGRLAAAGLEPRLRERLESRTFSLDEAGLAALAGAGVEPALLDEIRAKLAGRTYTAQRALFRDLKRLDNRPRSFRERKRIAKTIERTLRDREFTSAAALGAALAALDIRPAPRELALIVDATDASWRWSLANYRELAASQFTGKILLNTGFYVAFTLILNVGFALLLALLTFYLPPRQARFFRAVWLIPRISPSVIYVLLWKWFTYDSGFMSYFLGFFGAPARNYLLEYPWTFVVIINGMVGASMGLIIFSSAMQAIPRTLLYAARVDGAYPLQQVWRIILPQLRWPILFITSYQTLSLLTSFEYILLATDGGPGFYTTEVWALNAFHTALSNYFGNFRYGYGATLSVVLVVIGIALSLLYLKLFDFKRLVATPPIRN